jgi:hypothetical protein
MQLHDLIHSAKANPWWIVVFVLAFLVVATLLLLAQRMPSAIEHPATSSASADEQGQLKRTTRLGVLHGKRSGSSCEVAVLTREIPGLPPVVVGRYIQSVEISLPSGEYALFLDGATFQARLADSFWEIKS